MDSQWPGFGGLPASWFAGSAGQPSQSIPPGGLGHDPALGQFSGIFDRSDTAQVGSALPSQNLTQMQPLGFTQQQRLQQEDGQQNFQQHQARFNQQQEQLSALFEQQQQQHHHQSGLRPGQPGPAPGSKPSVHFNLDQQVLDANRAQLMANFKGPWGLPPNFAANASAQHQNPSLPPSISDLHASMTSAMPPLPGDTAGLNRFNSTQQAGRPGMGADAPFGQKQDKDGADAELSRARNSSRRASPFTASNYRVQHVGPGMPSGPTAVPQHQHRSFSVPTRFASHANPALQSVPEGSLPHPPPMRTADTIGYPAEYGMEDPDDSLDLDSLVEPFNFLHDHPRDPHNDLRAASAQEASTSRGRSGQGESRAADSSTMLGFPPPGRLNYLTPPELRKGKGGRQPAMDPRLDPNVDPKRAKRILANRLSAARSKMKQKTHVDGLRERASTLTKQRSHLQDEVQNLEKACADTQRENEQVMQQLQGLREQVKRQNMLNAKLIDERAGLMRAAAESEVRTQQLQHEAPPAAGGSFSSPGSAAPQSSTASPRLQHPQGGLPHSQQQSQSPRQQQSQQQQQPSPRVSQQQQGQQQSQQGQQQQQQHAASFPLPQTDAELEPRNSSLSQLWSGMGMGMDMPEMSGFDPVFLESSNRLSLPSATAVPPAFPAPTSTAF